MSSIYNDKRYRAHREFKRANRASHLGDSLLKQLDAAEKNKAGIQFPCIQFQDDIAGFAATVLGLESWSKQHEMYKAVTDAKNRVNKINRAATRASHKGSKTHSFAVIALHRYCCFEDSLTILSAPTERSVQRLVWREIRMLKSKSGVCLTCKRAGYPQQQAPCPHSGVIPGEASEMARTGLRGLGFAECFAVVAKEGESFAGYSSPSLCYLLDESSGMKDSHFEVMSSNMASSRNGFIFAVSNPTKRSGWFFNAFNKQAESWNLVHISAYDCVGVDIPGLATQQYIDDTIRDYGKESSTFRIRVLGEFDTEGNAGLFTPELLAAAVERWHENCASEQGILAIGIDPAGSTGEYDATGFSVRRGLHFVHLSTEYGLEAEQIYNHTLELVRAYQQTDRELVAIGLDSSGVGYDVQQVFRARARIEPRLVLTSIRSSDRAVRKPQTFKRMRDELVENLRLFLRDGGSLPPGECEPLLEEAACFAFSEDITNKLQATKKEHIRKQLGRSPDLFDAAALAAWITDLPVRRLKKVLGTPTENARVSRSPVMQDTSSLRARAQGVLTR